VTDTSRSAMHAESSKGKEVRILGPDHPITISPAVGKIRVTVAGRIIAESKRALRLEEKGYPAVYYLPRNDAHMSLDHPLFLLPVQGRLCVLQHSHRRIGIGIRRLDIRNTLRVSCRH